MKAQKCPVCDGTGKVRMVEYRSPGEIYPYHTSPIKYDTERVCNGCYGKGWILIPEDIPTDFNKII